MNTEDKLFQLVTTFSDEALKLWLCYLLHISGQCLAKIKNWYMKNGQFVSDQHAVQWVYLNKMYRQAWDVWDSRHNERFDFWEVASSDAFKQISFMFNDIFQC